MFGPSEIFTAIRLVHRSRIFACSGAPTSFVTLSTLQLLPLYCAREVQSEGVSMLCANLYSSDSSRSRQTSTNMIFCNFVVGFLWLKIFNKLDRTQFLVEHSALVLIVFRLSGRKEIRSEQKEVDYIRFISPAKVIQLAPSVSLYPSPSVIAFAFSTFHYAHLS